MLTDIEISRGAKMRPIKEIADSIGLNPETDIELYGNYKAKLTEAAYTRLAASEHTGKLILVTAMSPTKYGEGKTTMSIGLAQALSSLGHKTALALREPSLGPVFGLKGGATGGGYSQVVPMEDINLHFTGDMHAITSANNLLCAVLDNHIYQGNSLEIDPAKITFSRCMDTNDRAIKDIMVGLGGKNNIPRKDGFRITAASEIMAIFCLAESFAELKSMLGNITVGYNFGGAPVFARDLKVEGSLCALLKEAFLPNLVQSIEGVPVFVHGGPFANIAHGCNSVRATKAALKLADYAITEAGFGSDLGAEKFVDIKCKKSGLCPDAAVLVATVRAISHHGGGDIVSGFCNVLAHFENLRNFGINAVLALNRFPSDTEEELALISSLCYGHNIPFSFSTA
ncbi:MAG: formate--tetrahydrofolate ligase, partial [Oscillospiraceae bacterium]|nr:formate--tetrahydrofolate ligase [Oscillospiraceae bacterium]